MKDSEKTPSPKKPKKTSKNRVDIQWVTTIFVVTIVISACFSFLSNYFLNRVWLGAAFAILFLIVLIGILFFHDAVTFWRMFFLSLVFIGIVGLKLVH